MVNNVYYIHKMFKEDEFSLSYIMTEYVNVRLDRATDQKIVKIDTEESKKEWVKKLSAHHYDDHHSIRSWCWYDQNLQEGGWMIVCSLVETERTWLRMPIKLSARSLYLRDLQ